MAEGWRARVAENKLIGTAWPKISQHQDSRGRMANFALGSLYGAGVGPKDMVRRAMDVLPAQDGSNKELAQATLAVLKFLGDNFNKYLGSLEPEDFLQRPSHPGSAPSPILLEALQHEDPDYNGGIVYPETLDFLEKNGVISKADFFKFANLQVLCDQEIAGLATELQTETDQDARIKIRDRMVDVNCDSVGTLLCAFSHIFRPNAAISSTDDVTMDTLRDQFPMQFEIGRAWQYSYGAMACVNRIIREQDKGASDQPDPVIAELERMGAYNREFMAELKDVMSRRTDQSSVRLEELPEALQLAIKTVGEQAEEQIRNIPNASRVRKAIYQGITDMNVHGGVCNHAARHYYAGGQSREGQERSL